MRQYRFLFLLLLLPSGMVAQSLTLDTYTPATGLADARVQKIFQDSRGILYFLTRDGFSVFDGQQMQSYTEFEHQPLSVTTDIIEISKGRVMISSIVGVFYLEKNKLTKDSILSNSIHEPGYLLSGGKNIIYILSNNGLYVYQNNKLRAFGAAGTTGPDKAIIQGNLLLGLFTGTNGSAAKLVLYNLTDEKIIFEQPIPYYSDIAAFNGKAFIRLNQPWQELSLTALALGKWETALTAIQASLPAGFIPENFYSDNAGNNWFSSEHQGICRVDGITHSVIQYRATDGLTDPVKGFFTDAEKNTWLIIPGKGVQKMVRSGLQLNKPEKLQRVVSAESGSALLKNKDSLWLLRNGKQELIIEKEDPGVVVDFFWNEQRWKLYREGYIQNENGKQIRYLLPGLNAGQVSEKIGIDKDNRLMLSGDVFSVINPDYSFATVALPYFADNVVRDDKGRYWCFARDGEIVSYRLLNGKLVPVNAYKDNSFSARITRLWNQDTFCVGTRTGGIHFVKLNEAGYRWLGQVSTRQGLSNNFITELIPLPPHELLTGTAAGLDMVHLYPRDTIVEKEFGRINIFSGVHSMARTGDSTVIVVNDYGQAFRYEIHGAAGPGYQPAPFFSKLLVEGVTADPESARSFAYNRNHIRLSVSAPSFVDEKNILFLFRVEGPGLHYEQRGRRPDLELNNLAPGNYSVTVTVYFPGYQYTSGVLNYSFTIRKPFWETWIFRAAVFLITGLAVYALFRYLLQRKLMKEKLELEKEKAVAHERTRIARDMHDDLGAGISTIKFLSEGAVYIPQERQPENNRKISSQADALVDKMNDIIWAMNESNDTLDNLVLYTKSWVAEYANEHGIEARFSIPDNLPALVIRGEMRRNIFLCVKESVHNIIKHAGADWLKVEISFEHKKLSISIEDNGQGFNPDKIKTGNGLPNMKKRIQGMGGTWTATSGSTTCIRMEIPV